MKKDYTIIYFRSFKFGQGITSIENICIEKENLKKYIEENIGIGNVYFVFEGNIKPMENW